MAGDYITALWSTQIEVAGQLPQVISSLAPGTKTSITVLKRWEQKTLPVTIGERDAKDTVTQSQNL